MGTVPTLQTTGCRLEQGRQTHKLIWVIKCCKCQERIFREMRPTKEVSNVCRSDDDKKIFKDKMTLRMELER